MRFSGVAAARSAKAAGATRFCMGAAWRNPKGKNFERVLEMIKRRARQAGLPEGARVDTLEALLATTSHIGPAVVLTTIVLALGLGVTMLSDLPSLRLFGQLAAACLTASVIGQLVILPATIALYRRVFK